MRIIDLKTTPVMDWMEELLTRYPFPPYNWIRGVTPESSRELMRHELEEALESDKTLLLGYFSDGNDLYGFARVHHLAWDTQHFGAEIWRIDDLGAWIGPARSVTNALTETLIAQVKAQGGECIQARPLLHNLPAIHSLESNGFETMEVLTTWLFDLTRTQIPPQENPGWVRDFEPADTEALIDLARSVYAPIPDRFHVDPHLSPKVSNELYAEWIRNSCSGELADHIAVAEYEGEVLGYSTMRYFGDFEGRCNVRIGQLGLGAVAPTYRNRGLVTDVVVRNLEWLRDHGGTYVLVGTQGNNIPPQIVFLKLGLRPGTMSLTMHLWLD